MEGSPRRVPWFLPSISSYMLHTWLFIPHSAPTDCAPWASSVSLRFNHCISWIACSMILTPPYSPESLSPVEILHLTSHLDVMVHPAASIPSNNNNANHILSVIMATRVVIIAFGTQLCLALC